MSEKSEKHAWLTMTVGLPRSGKSTWIENHKDDNVVISNDWIRENLLGNQYHKASNAIVWTIVDASLRILLAQGKNVILDGANHTKDVRKFFVDIAREYGAGIKMVLFRTPLITCIYRNSKHPKLPENVLRKMSEEFEEPTGDECTYIELIEEAKRTYEEEIQSGR